MPIDREDHVYGVPSRYKDGRVVEVYQRFGDRQSKTASGSGYILDGGLVLTAAHVVQRGSTALIRTSAVPQPLVCEVVWRRYDNPSGTGVDAALLRIVDAHFIAPHQPAVQWGMLVTTAECSIETTGFPASMEMWRGDRLEYREPAQISGVLLPGSRSKANRYEISVRTPVPETPELRRHEHGEDQVSRWSGMSGSAVMARGMLVGLVVWDPDPTGGTLTAVPVGALLADPAFHRLVGNPRSRPVELDSVFDRPPADPRSPIGLLRPDVETVRFHGREDTVTGLWDWCLAPEVFGVRLVTGPAGSGKTRLACEMIERLRREGWCVGFLSVTCTREQMEVLSQLTEPLLLVVDYAETKGEQLRSLLQVLERGSGHVRSSLGIRLLLLARSEGEWWGRLRITTRILRGLPSGSVLPMSELESDGSNRLESFREAVVDLRAGLLSLPAYQAVADLLDPAQIEPPPLRQPEYARALNLQVSALAGLLRHLPLVGEAADEQDENVLLEHEGQFWAGTAPTHGLAHLHDSTLRQLVAVVTLCPVTGPTDAIALLEQLSMLRGETANTLMAVSAWLHELYAADGEYWAPLVPDALGEYLVGSMGPNIDSLLNDLARSVNQSQAEQMLTVLSGATERFPALTDTVVRHVVARPRPIAFAAIALAVRGSHSVLHMALDRVVNIPRTDAALVEDLIDAVPRLTLSLTGLAVRLTAQLVALRSAQVKDNARGLLEVAQARLKSAFRLAMVSERDEALNEVVEAVRLSQEAVERFGAEPDVLVDCLLSLGARLAALGRKQEAVRSGHDAVELCRALDQKRGELRDRERLATALHHQAVWLHDMKAHLVAESIGAQAVRIRTLLVDSSARSSAELANSRMNYAIYLHDAGHSANGLPHARAAVDAYRPLAEDSPDAHLVSLGRALLNLARLLAALGNLVDALTFAEEAVLVYRQFVREDTVNPRAELAIALSNYGKRLAACGRIPEAVNALEEAEGLCRELVASNWPTATGDLAAVRRDLAALRQVAGGHPGVD